MRFGKSIAACTALLTQACLAQYQLLDSFEIPRQVDKRKIGYGYDLFTNEVKTGSCLAGAKVAEDKNTDPGGRQSTYYMVADSEQVAKAVSGSVSASYSGGYASASASASFSNSFAFESDSTWIVGRKLVPYTVTTILAAPDKDNKPGEIGGGLFDVRKDRMKNVGKTSDALLKFRQQCGDGYISAITEGGLLMGKIRVANSSQVEKSSFEAKMSGGGMGMSGSASLSESSMQAFTNKSVNTDTVEIGSDRTATPTGVTEFIDYFKNFGLPKGFSVRPIQITVTSYTALPSWPRVREADLTNIPSAINEALLARARLIDLEKRYAVVRQNADGYYNLFYKDWFAFDAEHDRIAQSINALGYLMKSCASNLNDCRFKAITPEQLTKAGSHRTKGTSTASINDLLTRNLAFYMQSNRTPDQARETMTIGDALTGFDFAQLSKDYYLWRISVPWQRNVDLAQDELEVFLGKRSLTPLKDKIASQTLNAEELTSLKSNAVDWVLNQKFDVWRSSYCSAVAASNPLCGVSRASMAGVIQVYFYDKGIVVPPKPAPVPPPTKVERSDRPFRGPCGPRMGDFSCL